MPYSRNSGNSPSAFLIVVHFCHWALWPLLLACKTTQTQNSKNISNILVLKTSQFPQLVCNIWGCTGQGRVSLNMWSWLRMCRYCSAVPTFWVWFSWILHFVKVLTVFSLCTCTSWFPVLLNFWDRGSGCGAQCPQFSWWAGGSAKTCQRRF